MLADRRRREGEGEWVRQTAIWHTVDCAYPSFTLKPGFGSGLETGTHVCSVPPPTPSASYILAIGSGQRILYRLGQGCVSLSPAAVPVSKP